MSKKRGLSAAEVAMTDAVAHHPGCGCEMCRPVPVGCTCPKCKRILARREPKGETPPVSPT